MGLGHDHGMPTTAAGNHSRRMALVLGITLSVMVLELIGALVSGSLALLSDAGHMFTDAAGVTIALIATRLAATPANDQRTFGLQRTEILAALSNAVVLIVIAVLIVVEAISRLGSAASVHSMPMLIFGIIGLVANAISMSVLASGQKASLNVRGAYLEVLGDLLGSAAVIVASVVIMTTGFEPADSIASLLIAAMILPRAWSLLRDVVNVLLEATPKGIDLEKVRDHVSSVPGVIDLHDLHAWTITSGVPVLSAHVVVERDWLDADGIDHVLDRLADCLRGHFDVEHCTFQLEPADHSAHEPRLHD
ncbi:cation diffusion facilitator family transporter [Spelaeicoccus albus]|uniref:Cobalt-zinc-cadmium efflux system protein n=1 Tax=Spelaeicoccus albus TaxID=1280376 RepID=A0A7Z0A9H9_9MICO|nr:cation diffusion facilitator family transporter [Spelaeicoccus albus]NYI66063.1 cobalt-zinc-cadmium efflux system protein [Spelaeicoccus albus]